jgi:hypothetical protein
LSAELPIAGATRPEVLAQRVFELALPLATQNSTIAARPVKNSARLRHCESWV